MSNKIYHNKFDAEGFSFYDNNIDNKYYFNGVDFIDKSGNTAPYFPDYITDIETEIETPVRQAHNDSIYFLDNYTGLKCFLNWADASTNGGIYYINNTELSAPNDRKLNIIDEDISLLDVESIDMYINQGHVNKIGKLVIYNFIDGRLKEQDDLYKVLKDATLLEKYFSSSLKKLLNSFFIGAGEEKGVDYLIRDNNNNELPLQGYFSEPQNLDSLKEPYYYEKDKTLVDSRFYNNFVESSNLPVLYFNLNILSLAVTLKKPSIKYRYYKLRKSCLKRSNLDDYSININNDDFGYHNNSTSYYTYFRKINDAIPCWGENLYNQYQSDGKFKTRSESLDTLLDAEDIDEIEIEIDGSSSSVKETDISKILIPYNTDMSPQLLDDSSENFPFKVNMIFEGELGADKIYKLHYNKSTTILSKLDSSNNKIPIKKGKIFFFALTNAGEEIISENPDAGSAVIFVFNIFNFLAAEGLDEISLKVKINNKNTNSTDIVIEDDNAETKILSVKNSSPYIIQNSKITGYGQVIYPFVESGMENYNLKPETFSVNKVSEDVSMSIPTIIRDNITYIKNIKNELDIQYENESTSKFESGVDTKYAGTQCDCIVGTASGAKPLSYNSKVYNLKDIRVTNTEGTLKANILYPYGSTSSSLIQTINEKIIQYDGLLKFSDIMPYMGDETRYTVIDKCLSNFLYAPDTENMSGTPLTYENGFISYNGNKLRYSSYGAHAYFVKLAAKKYCYSLSKNKFISITDGTEVSLVDGSEYNVITDTGQTECVWNSSDKLFYTINGDKYNIKNLFSSYEFIINDTSGSVFKIVRTENDIINYARSYIYASNSTYNAAIGFIGSNENGIFFDFKSSENCRDMLPGIVDVSGLIFVDKDSKLEYRASDIHSGKFFYKGLSVLDPSRNVLRTYNHPVFTFFDSEPLIYMGSYLKNNLLPKVIATQGNTYTTYYIPRNNTTITSNSSIFSISGRSYYISILCLEPGEITNKYCNGNSKYSSSIVIENMLAEFSSLMPKSDILYEINPSNIYDDIYTYMESKNIGKGKYQNMGVPGAGGFIIFDSEEDIWH